MEKVAFGNVETNCDVDELLAETVRKYPVLYDKTLKTLKTFFFSFSGF